MPTTNSAYDSEYGVYPSPQTLGFRRFNDVMMHQPTTQPSVHVAQQLEPRQQAAMRMMAPNIASINFYPETGSARASMQHPSGGSSASTGVYQQNQPMYYPSRMPYTTAMQHMSGTADPAMVEGQDYAASGLQKKWLQYQRQLRSVFQDISSISLERAAETLLSVSSSLLTQAEELGLNQDDASLHTERIKLWNDLNHAWLALCFQQSEVMYSGRRLSESQSVMSHRTIEKLGDELIRHCDDIEKYGLVDYQNGVWEDRIETALEDCLDLYDSIESNTNTGGR